MFLKIYKSSTKKHFILKCFFDVIDLKKRKNNPLKIKQKQL